MNRGPELQFYFVEVVVGPEVLSLQDFLVSMEYH